MSQIISGPGLLHQGLKQSKVWWCKWKPRFANLVWLYFVCLIRFDNSGMPVKDVRCMVKGASSSWQKNKSSHRRFLTMRISVRFQPASSVLCLGKDLTHTRKEMIWMMSSELKCTHKPRKDMYTIKLYVLQQPDMNTTAAFQKAAEVPGTDLAWGSKQFPSKS